MAALMLAMDVLVLVTQAFDLYFFHFHSRRTRFGQLNGTGLASALLGHGFVLPVCGHRAARPTPDGRYALSRGTRLVHFVPVLCHDRVPCARRRD